MMTITGVKRLLNQKNFQVENLANRTDMVYQGQGFNGYQEFDGEWKTTHCWSPVAAVGADILVWAKSGTPVSKTLFDKFIRYCKDISPNIKKNIEDYPPEHTPCMMHFHDHTAKTGYPQYYFYVLWKQLFQNPKGVVLWVYFRELGFDAAEAFVLLMQLKHMWYADVYGGRILEHPEDVDGAKVLENLRNVDNLPHDGNYGMRRTVITRGNFTMLVANIASHIESINDLTEENLRVIIDMYETNTNPEGTVEEEEEEEAKQAVYDFFDEDDGDLWLEEEEEEEVPEVGCQCEVCQIINNR